MSVLYPLQQGCQLRNESAVLDVFRAHNVLRGLIDVSKLQGTEVLGQIERVR
jgi:hypothetical protein